MDYYIVTTPTCLIDCKLKKTETREYTPYTSIYMKFKKRRNQLLLENFWLLEDYLWWVLIRRMHHEASGGPPGLKLQKYIHMLKFTEYSFKIWACYGVTPQFK